MKRFLVSILVVCMVICFTFAVACKKDKDVSDILGLNTYSIQLEVGKQETLVCTVKDGGECVWASSDETVATVDGGVVTALKVGSAEISATAKGETVSCSVTVVSANVSNSNFSIDKKTASIFKGHTLTIKPALIFGSDKIEVEADKVVWASSDESVATVNNGGVTGVGTGSVTITATYVYNGVTLVATSEFTVKDLLFVEFAEGYEINIVSKTTLSGKTNDKNVSETLEYKVLDDNGNDVTATISKSSIQFISSNEQVVTVDGNGVATAVGTGQAVISVVCEGSTSAVDVNVMTAIAEKADLDKLAFAYKNGQSELWSGNYMLTSDIDYQGKQIIPIAPYITDGDMNWKNKFANSEWGQLNDNTNPVFFSGVIDGAGYAIKNALLPFNYIYASNYSLLSCFIGGLTGTLKNIAFVNLATENPKNVTNWANDITFNTAVNARAQHSGLIYWVKSGAKVENVYVDLTNGLMMAANGFGAIAYRLSDGSTIKDCIANIKATSGYWYHYVDGMSLGAGMFGQYKSSVIQNCFMIDPGNLGSYNFVTCNASSSDTSYNTGREYTSYANLNEAQASVLATFGGAWNYASGVLKMGNITIG